MKSVYANRRLILFLALICGVFAYGQAPHESYQPDMSLLPAICRQYINKIDIDKLGGNEAVQHIEVVNKDLVRVRLTFDLNKTTCQDDWQVRITPAFAPTFNWSPHLTPNDKNIIDQHVFRSPALIVAD